MSDGVVMDRLVAASARLRFQLVHHKVYSASGALCYCKEVLLMAAVYSWCMCTVCLSYLELH